VFEGVLLSVWFKVSKIWERMSVWGWIGWGCWSGGGVSGTQVFWGPKLVVLSSKVAKLGDSPELEAFCLVTWST
jgi:hypothetical protein